jgi:hypothetical protein
LGCLGDNSVQTEQNGSTSENKENKKGNKEDVSHLHSKEEIPEFEGITRFCSELIYEINKVRNKPSSYSEFISKNKSNFNGLIFKTPNSKYNDKTKEGVAAYEEAEQFLKTCPENQNDLIPSVGLCRIAQEFLKEFNDNGIEIDKVDKIDIKKIIDKYGKCSGNLCKLIACGGDELERIVINLIVCDGDQNREQRNKLFDESFKKIGVAHGKHPIYRYISIFILSTDLENKNDQDDVLDI